MMKDFKENIISDDKMLEKTVLNYSYLIDPIAKGLIVNKPYLELEDLRQQGILIIMENIRNQGLELPLFYTDEDVELAIIEVLTIELSTYVNHIDNYMSRKVRCNRTSNKPKMKTITEELFAESGSKINKKVLHEIMYPSGKYNKYDIASKIIIYLMELGICPSFPIDILVTDETDANKILELVAEYLM